MIVKESQDSPKSCYFNNLKRISLEENNFNSDNARILVANTGNLNSVKMNVNGIIQFMIECD